MQVATFYTDTEAELALSDRFGFTYHGQDWDLVNANSERVSEFISYFLETDTHKELVVLFDLIIASIDDLKLGKEQTEHLNQIKAKTVANCNFFLNTIVYWSCIGSGEDPDKLWSITPQIREFLKEVTTFENFAINCNEIYCIKAGDHELKELVNGKGLNYTFEEIIGEICSNNNLQLNEETILKVELFDGAFYWNIYHTTEQHVFKFNKELYLNEIKKYET